MTEAPHTPDFARLLSLQLDVPRYDFPGRGQKWQNVTIGEAVAMGLRSRRFPWRRLRNREPNPECPGDCGLCAPDYTCEQRRNRDDKEEK